MRLSKGQPYCHKIAFAIIANAIIMLSNKNNKPQSGDQGAYR
jgi:hypothetical protein